MTGLTIGSAALSRASGSRLQEWWDTVDRWSLAALLLLFATGIVLALAASPPLAAKNGVWPYFYVARHAVFAILAFSVIVAISMSMLRTIRRTALIMFLAVLAATALLPWLGTDFGKGAVRWYSLGVTSLQPSEFLKPLFIVASAWLMAGAVDRGGPPGRTISGIFAFGIAVMLALQPDFGQAMLVLSIWAVMLFASGSSVILLIVLSVIVAGAGSVAYLTSEHVARRIDAFLADGVDPHTQMAYAQSAIREGGIFGVGAAQGQVKWALPDAHTDFIIAVAAEEFGLIATLFLIGLYLFITLRALGRLVEERDPFVRLAGTGLAVGFAMQAFINLSVAIRLLPAKGMTLPFVSYGGSSMMAAALGIGALLALTRTRRREAGG